LADTSGRYVLADRWARTASVVVSPGCAGCRGPPAAL